MTGVAAPWAAAPGTASGCGTAGAGSGWRMGRAVIGGEAATVVEKRGASVRAVSTLAWGKPAGAMEDRDGRNRAETVSGDPGGGRLVSRPRTLPPRRLFPAGRRVRPDRPVGTRLAPAARGGR